MQLKLVRGAGSPQVGACWMSAISYYAGYEWSDHPACVDPAIRGACIALNDALGSDEDRANLIGPHLFAPLGTAGSPELSRQRALMFANIALRRWLPEMFLKKNDLHVSPEMMLRFDVTRPGGIDSAWRFVQEMAYRAQRGTPQSPFEQQFHSLNDEQVDVRHFGLAMNMLNLLDEDDNRVMRRSMSVSIPTPIYYPSSLLGGDMKQRCTDAVGYGASLAIRSMSPFGLLNAILSMCNMGTKTEVPQKRDVCELPQLTGGCS